MKHITVLVPDGQTSLSTVSSVLGAVEILQAANRFRASAGTFEPYPIVVAGAAAEVDCNNGLVALRPPVHFSAIRQTGLIIIPSSAIRDFEQATPGNQQLMRWIGQQYQSGAEVASICSGAFMLAASGVLRGKACSTHWAHVPAFRQMFPDVQLRENVLITDEHGIYTNGGAYSFLHLLIYLVEKYFDRPTAIYCSKMFQIDIDRQSQSAFAIFSSQKNHDDDVVMQAQAHIENNLQERLSIDCLCAKFAVGRRQFDRRFLKATGNTPLEYVQRVRIESAKKALESTRRNVTEVMYEVGYSDTKAFRNLFRKITGMSPLEYRGKYHKDAF